ncbi:hypothetical protein PHMEG_00033086 [Phytophthora megakarya]|uniref:Uncharacterized protein n=1 Tax=Phytophthora megakarya TaxID=4795 RepID=A0A225UUQ1_9STRA|nr:hypothetical protein PHMEG_00033086 [Phytophthora megakarya]
MASAIKHGSLGCVKKDFRIDILAQRGYLPLINYLHQISTVNINDQDTKKARNTPKNCLACTSQAMDQAAANNYWMWCSGSTLTETRTAQHMQWILQQAQRSEVAKYLPFRRLYEVSYG